VASYVQTFYLIWILGLVDTPPQLVVEEGIPQVPTGSRQAHIVLDLN
jgi:hypothetical protein